jgi:hypothetical protein
MLRYLRNPFLSLMLCVVLVTACATAQVSSVWRDPAYQARPARVMVIGVVKNPLNRRLFEDEFVLQPRRAAPMRSRATQFFPTSCRMTRRPSRPR